MNRLVLNCNTLRSYVERGLLRTQKHPTLPLNIWNYTEQVQFNNLWDDITLRCRGVITDQDGRVIAHPLKKFFNYGSVPVPLQVTDSFKVYEKLDGSLGILFHYQNQWLVATRGSFISDQAERAMKMLCKYDLSLLNTELTHCFEIIYPENRIVVSYGDKEELIYLCSFDSHGREIEGLRDIMLQAGFSVAKIHDNIHDYTSIRDLNWENSEGFVVRFDNGERVKIKFENYLALHRLISNLNENTLWEWFRTGVKLEDKADDIPDEFTEFCEKNYAQFKNMQDEIQTSCQKLFDEAMAESPDRAGFAKKVGNSEYKAILFHMLDKRPTDEAIFRIIEKRLKLQRSKKQEEKKASKKATAEPISSYIITEDAKNDWDEEDSPKMILCVGISGSGKSTWARQMVLENQNHVIVGRDKIRELLFGVTEETVKDYYSYPPNKLNHFEHLVSEMQETMIEKALQLHQTVIVDDTNLKAKYLNAFRKKFIYARHEYKVFDIDMAEAKNRIKNRRRAVDDEILTTQSQKFKQLKKIFDFSPYTPPKFRKFEQDPAKPGCYVFDIDGTLALHEDRRNVFDLSKVDQDAVNEPVAKALRSHRKAGYHIIICTGRDESSRSATEEWLKKYSLSYDKLLMREEKDHRPDWKIKEELWAQICESFHIIAMYDDRNQVVDHARRLGFSVFQVNYGNF